MQNYANIVTFSNFVTKSNSDKKVTQYHFYDYQR